MTFKYHPFKASSILFAIIMYIRERELIIQSNQAAQKINEQINAMTFEPVLDGEGELPLQIFDSHRIAAANDVKFVQYKSDSLFRVQSTPTLIWCCQDKDKSSKYMAKESKPLQQAIVALFCKMNEPVIAQAAIDMVKESIVATRSRNPAYLDKYIALGQKLEKGGLITALMQCSDQKAAFNVLFPNKGGKAPSLADMMKEHFSKGVTLVPENAEEDVETVILRKDDIIKWYGSVEAFLEKVKKPTIELDYKKVVEEHGNVEELDSLMGGFANGVLVGGNSGEPCIEVDETISDPKDEEDDGNGLMDTATNDEEIEIEIENNQEEE